MQIFFKGQVSQVQVHEISPISKVNPEVCVCCLLLLSCLTTYGAGSRAAELLCPSEYMCAVAAQTVICSASPPIIEAAKISTRLHPQ